SRINLYICRMRKNLLLICLLCISGALFAQDSTRTVSYERKNDVLIDPIFLIAAPALNASYERILNADYGVGVHALLGLGAMDEIVQISPYARMYLGQRYASGFFLEAFFPITSSEEYEESFEKENTPSTRETTFGFGVGMGGKWVLKKNIIFEIGGGVGRRLFYDGPN